MRAGGRHFRPCDRDFLDDELVLSRRCAGRITPDLTGKPEAMSNDLQCPGSLITFPCGLCTFAPLRFLVTCPREAKGLVSSYSCPE